MCKTQFAFQNDLKLFFCRLLFRFLFAESKIEENPKWGALKDVLDEIDDENERLAAEGLPPQRVLVVAADDRTCSQIKQVGEIFQMY